MQTEIINPAPPAPVGTPASTNQTGPTGAAAPDAPGVRRPAHAPAPLPDWCNLGIMLRVVLGINLLFASLAGAHSASFAAWGNEFLALALTVEPVLIASLLAGCGLRRLGMHFGPRNAGVQSKRHASAAALIQIGLAVALPALLTWMLQYALQPLISRSGFELLRNALFAGLLAGIVIYWVRLRQRAGSPALAEARLQALQARIRPHFLFNSLNAVLGLMRADPRRAEGALEDLADLFRVLMRDSRERFPLANEVALCKQYLAIESLRLGDRLRIEWRVDASVLEALVPVLILQPLVENAVHHGVEPRPSGGLVTISAARDGNQVVLTVANTWAATNGSTGRAGNHMAIDNIRERLALIHDLEARLVTAVKDGRYEVRMTLPLQTK